VLYVLDYIGFGYEYSIEDFVGEYVFPNGSIVIDDLEESRYLMIIYSGGGFLGEWIVNTCENRLFYIVRITPQVIGISVENRYWITDMPMRITIVFNTSYTVYDTLLVMIYSRWIGSPGNASYYVIAKTIGGYVNSLRTYSIDCEIVFPYIGDYELVFMVYPKILCTEEIVYAMKKYALNISVVEPHFFFNISIEAPEYIEPMKTYRLDISIYNNYTRTVLLDIDLVRKCRLVIDKSTPVDIGIEPGEEANVSFYIMANETLNNTCSLVINIYWRDQKIISKEVIIKPLARDYEVEETCSPGSIQSTISPAGGEQGLWIPIPIITTIALSIALYIMLKYIIGVTGI